MTARPVVSVDARLAEIEQRAKRAKYVSFMGGYGETGDARELLSKDVPWLLSQLRDARAEIESARFRRDQAYDERDAALTNSDALCVENEQLRARLTEHADCDLRNAAELRELRAENERLRERPTYRIAGGRACKIHAESFRVVEADRAAAEARAQALEAKVQAVEALAQLWKRRNRSITEGLACDQLRTALTDAEQDEPKSACSTCDGSGALRRHRGLPVDFRHSLGGPRVTRLSASRAGGPCRSDRSSGESARG